MKISMFYRSPFETGGIEKGMYNRAKLFKKMGHEITFIFKDLRNLDILKKWAEVGNVIQQDYCNDKFDIVIYDGIYELPNIKAKKKIQIFNGNLIDGNEKYFIDFKIDENIAVSEDCANQVKKLCGIDCKVIPNVLEEDIKTKMLEKYEYKKAKYNFLVVGRFDSNKGYHKLIKIVKEIDEKLKDYQFIFVGSNDPYPAYMNEMKELYKDYNVLFVGKQDNPYKFMYNADVVFIPSTYESQCMVLDESLICGTPVVSTDFETAKKKINGKNGILIDKDFQNYNLEEILKLKKDFKYEYPDLTKKWEEIIKIPPKKNYKFSIIIPNFNNGQWLDECLTSVLNQTYTNYELIFIDDMSTDNSLEIVQKYYLKFVDICKGMKIIKVPYKKYNGGTRNLGIVEATGDYIICIDSDDHLKRNTTLKEINDNLDDEDVMFLGFDLSDGQQEGLYPFVPKYQNMYQAFINDVCACWTKVIKTNIFKETLFPESTLAEDKVHHYRICDKANSFVCFEDSTHVWNRANSTSVTTKRNLMWEMSIYKHLGEMYYFMRTTKNIQYKNYVENKFNKQLQELSSKKYEQI